jgi:aryl-alcohol dehydrogenase-like predicted oxidoreductase
MTAATTLRPLGTTGLQVSALCFGGNVLGWTLDGDEAFAVLDRYAERPGAFVDTADAYSAWVDGHEGGESERLLARWLSLRGGAHGVVLATKLGWRGGLGRENVLRCAHASLDRLGVDRVDLLYAHKDDPDTPLEETMAAFDALVREGVVGHVGLSNYTPARVRSALEVCDAHGLTRPSVLQPPYSLVAREEFEGELQELSAQEGLGVATYAALAAGFLTGKYTRDGAAPDTARARSVTQRFGGDGAWAALDGLLAVARERDAEPAAVAVAWVMAQPAVTSAIASATSLAQLDTLLAALDLELTDAELARLGQTAT